jgi:hypothetical protein
VLNSACFQHANFPKAILVQIISTTAMQATSLYSQISIPFLCNILDGSLQEMEEIRVTVRVVDAVNLPCRKIDQMRMLTCVLVVFLKL